MYFETLPPALANATVGDVAQRPVLVCGADTPLRSVAASMAAKRIHSVVVRDAPRGVHGWGVVTDVTLVKALAEDRLDATAGDVAGPPAVVADPDTPLLEAVRLMGPSGASHLLLFGVSPEEPVAILSALDLAATWVWGLG